VKRRVDSLAPVLFMVGLVFYVQGDGWQRWAGLVAVGIGIGCISAAAAHD